MIQSSDFYNKLSRLESARQTGVNNLAIKGVTVANNASIPTVMSKILTVQTTSIQTQNTTINTNGNVVIIAAELPNTIIKLYDGDTLIDTQTTNATYGGPVTFTISSSAQKTYTVKAFNNDTQLWQNTITVNGIGTYNCKSGKAFADYTPAEVNTAAKNHYAQYMWSAGDSRNITTVGSSKKWVIAGFEHDNKTAGGKAGLTMVMESYTGSTYKHNNTNDNTIGWEGSLIRQNGLKVGDIVYKRASVADSTSGTYYVFDTVQDDWVEKTLPDDYVANEVYYTQEVASADGAFITGLPDWKDYMVSVLKPTADAGTGYKKIIKSSDHVFLLSDCEVFGNERRYSSRYSRYEYEGEQYEYFKNKYSDGKIRLGSGWWLRSPYSGGAATFCSCHNGGYVDTVNASSTSYARLAFCL